MCFRIICSALLLHLAVTGISGSPHTAADGDTAKSSIKEARDSKKYSRYISSRCSAGQRLTEATAWAERDLLAKNAMFWGRFPEFDKPTYHGDQVYGNYSEVFAMYMGQDSNGSYINPNDISGNTLTDRVRDPIMSQAYLRGMPEHGYMYVYCDELDIPPVFYDNKINCSKEKKTCCLPGQLAYSWNDVGTVNWRYVTILCPDFWSTPTLSQQIRYLKANPQHANEVEKMYNTVGGTYYETLFHYAPTISIFNITDRITDIKYDPAGLMNLATQGAMKATLSARSFMMVAVTILQMNAFGLTTAPRPAANYISPDGLGDIQEKITTLVSSPWVGPQDVNDVNSLPELNHWIEPTPAWTTNTTDYLSYTVLPVPSPSCVPNVPFLTSFAIKDTETSVQDFCSYMTKGGANGGVVQVEPNKSYIRRSYTDAAGKVGMGAGNRLWASVSLVQQKECASGLTIDEALCKTLFASIYNGCPTVDGQRPARTFGGSVVQGCGIFELSSMMQLDSALIPPKLLTIDETVQPPWHAY